MFNRKSLLITQYDGSVIMGPGMINQITVSCLYV